MTPRPNKSTGTEALGRICSIDEIQMVVTDAPPDSPAVKSLLARGVRVIQPPDAEQA
jgi:DeoR/GlpR family transcriptional regulator of sugar metabolism